MVSAPIYLGSLRDRRRPFCREELRQLQRDARLRDRGGREWTVRAAAYLDPEVRECRAVLVAGAWVTIERKRFHDGYMVPSAS